MKTTRKIFLFMLINLIMSLHLYSQEEISPECLKILKYLKEYPLPVNTSSFEMNFKKDISPNDGTYTYLMNLNSDDIYYLYLDFKKGGVNNLTKGMWMEGKDITLDYLNSNHLVVGYTLCKKCIMLYYIGRVPEKDIDVTLNVEYMKFNGEKIELFIGEESIDNNEILSAYFLEEDWIKKSTIIEECTDLNTKVILNDEDEERRIEYFVHEMIDIESGKILRSK